MQSSRISACCVASPPHDGFAQRQIGNVADFFEDRPVPGLRDGDGRARRPARVS